MALGDPYLTTEEFKARSRSSSSANDTAIAAVLLSASRSIDGFCGRTFNKSATAEARVFTLPCRGGYGSYGGSGVTFISGSVSGYAGILETGDLVSVAELATDSTGDRTYATVWSAQDFDLYPLNAAVQGQPYREIRSSPLGSFGFPTSVQGIRVTGIWGYPSVPAPVKEVCFLAANRLKSLWDAPFGLSGGGEMGALDMTVSLTPILKEMLAPYRVMPV